jgi:4-hydroxy-3-methylbut-2-enyl diphosphate reductase
LRELAERIGASAFLIDDASDLQQSWFNQKQTVGVTAGASAPEVLVEQVIAKVREFGGKAPVELDGALENITFSLPKELR